MISKISQEEIVKGFISDYSKIKDGFKMCLRNNGFFWDRNIEKANQFGREGGWINLISKVSIRVRWGRVTPRAIIYVEKRFLDTISDFFDSYKIVNGMATPKQDYDTLNLIIKKEIK